MAIHAIHKFLSTLSLRRATLAARWVLLTQIFLSTLSLRRATPSIQVQHLPKSISIHALLAESDSGAISCSICSSISIHALLAESDHSRRSRKQRHPYFYPRSPCGERPWGAAPPSPPRAFLSTLSLRRATRRSIFLWRAE